MCIYVNEKKRSGGNGLEFHAVHMGPRLQHGSCSRLNQPAAMSPRADGMRRRNPWQEVAGSLCPPAAHESPGLASPRLAVSCRPLGRGDSCQAAAIRRGVRRVGGVRVPAWNPPPLLPRKLWPSIVVLHWRRHLEHSFVSTNLTLRIWKGD